MDRLGAQNNRAVTPKAAELDRKIEEVERAIREGNTTVNPQSASMARAIGADQDDLIAAISHVFFAISIEPRSGVGFWLVFGHGRREDDTVLTAERSIVPLHMTLSSSSKHLRHCRSFLPRGSPSGARSPGAIPPISLAYKRWCGERPERGASPMRMFGKRARWPKERSAQVALFGISTPNLHHTLGDAYPTPKILPGPAAPDTSIVH